MSVDTPPDIRTVKNNQSLVHSAPLELEQTLAAIQVQMNTEPVVWLQGSQNSVAFLQPFIKAQAEAVGRPCLLATAPTAEGFALAPICSVLRQLVPYAEREVPGLLVECAPELVKLLPELAGAPTTNQAASLESLVPIHLALARMLPQQSEYLLRIVTKIGWFIVGTVQQSRIGQGQPPLFMFPALDQADRPTLLAVYHLCQRAKLGVFHVVVTSTWPPIEKTIETKHDLFDTHYERHLVLTRLYERVAPATINVSFKVAQTQPPPAVPGDGVGEEAAAHQEAKKTLRTADSTTTRAALQRAFALSSRYFNIELILNLAKEVLSNPAIDHSLAITVWEAVGVAHATLGNYSRALTCFQRGFDLATDDIVARAQMAMYLALVSAKRMGSFEEARCFLMAGYEAIKGIETADTALERGWLNNVNALIAYRNRNYHEAFRLTRDALQFMKPYRDEEATGLKTNLVTNISILFESVGQYRQALEVWQRFKTFLGEAGPLFDKYYLFREAGLSLKAGLEAGAMDSYKKAFDAATCVGDPVSMEATARALVCLSYRSGDYETAVNWAERIPALAERLGDQEQLWRSWVTLAACRRFLPDISGAKAALQKAIDLLVTTDQAAERETVAVILAHVQSSSLDAVDWANWLPDLPSTLLRWPTHLVVP